MIYENALRLAKELIETDNEIISKVVELSDSWIFMGGTKDPNDVMVGATNKRIFKQTGEIQNFSIQPIENLKLLKSGTIIFDINKK